MLIQNDDKLLYPEFCVLAGIEYLSDNNGDWCGEYLYNYSDNLHLKTWVLAMYFTCGNLSQVSSKVLAWEYSAELSGKPLGYCLLCRPDNWNHIWFSFIIQSHHQWQSSGYKTILANCIPYIKESTFIIQNMGSFSPKQGW